MREQEIRERIERFLKRTAQTVVVPATMGLGLSLAGCDRHALRAGPADAGGAADAGVVGQEPDAAAGNLRDVDLSPFAPLYGFLVLQDSGPKDAPEVSSEAGSDAQPDLADAGPDLPLPAPPYVLFLEPQPSRRSNQ